MQSSDLGNLTSWLQNIRDVHRLHSAELDSIQVEELRFRRLVELNVREQCINLLEVAEVQSAYSAEGLVIAGWVFDMATGLIKDQSVSVAHVRDGKEGEIAAAELVLGDLVVLVAGARVPADGRIIECVRMQIEESALTGESTAVTKTADPVGDQNAVPADRLNMVFLGTTVTDGRGRLLVTATGSGTEVGKIGVLIDEATTRATPLELKLAKLGRMLIAVTLVLCAIIVLAGWLRGVSDLWHVLEIGLVAYTLHRD